jgi:uncharacterized protein YecE (DUF72 family)
MRTTPERNAGTEEEPVSGKVRIGTQGWNYPDWVGPFYPEGTRGPDFLTRYARAFGTVEVDSTFYAIPPARTVRGWGARTPAGFVFALKMPAEATHERGLVGAEEVAARFLDAARELGEKLGPVLVQLGPDFAPEQRGALAGFLAALPDDVRFAVEVRQRRWTRPEVLPALLALLAERNVALTLSDGRWIPRETMLSLAERPTADFHYVRWMGPDRAITAFSRVVHDRSAELAAWAEALRRAAGRGMDVYGYANNHFAGHSPATAREVQRLLGERPVEPQEIGEQISLF